MFAWSYFDGSGEEIGRSRDLAGRYAAEDWMSECWSDLWENGIEEVVLYDPPHDRRVYGMGPGAAQRRDPSAKPVPSQGLRGRAL